MNKNLILSLISLGLISFLSVLIETSLNVTFAYLIQTFNIDINKASLLTSMFLLAITLTMPLSSYLVNQINTKKLFIFTNLLFLISLIICSSAGEFYILVFARFLQGIAAGIALPLMFNMVIFKASEKYFGFLMGFCIFLVATAPGFGPIYGGFIMKYFQFKDIFIFLIPFLVFAFVLGIKNIPNLGTKYKLDLKEYILIVLLVISVAISIKYIYILFFSILIIFMLNKSKIIASAKNLQFFSSTLIVFLMQFFALSYSLILPNYLIMNKNYDNFEASKVMLLGSLIAAILSPISGYLSDKFGSFKLSLLGIFIIIIANILLLNIEEKTLLNLSICYLIYAFAQGLSMSALISYSIKISKDKTNANNYINTFQQSFGSYAVMIISIIFNNNYEIGFLNSIKLILFLAFLQLILIYFAFRKKSSNGL